MSEDKLPARSRKFLTKASEGAHTALWGLKNAATEGEVSEDDPILRSWTDALERVHEYLGGCASRRQLPDKTIQEIILECL